MARICIVAHFAYGAMAGGDRGQAGGVERQTSIMARWLAEQGHTVSMVTWDEGQAAEISISGVRMLKLCRQDSGWPGIRFFHPRWTSLNMALGLADAELYYQNCAEYVTGQVALWCRRHRRCFVYSVASDPECDPQLPELHTLRERLLFKYGLKHADRVIVQTQKQRQMLKESFILDAAVLPMPCPKPSSDAQRAPIDGAGQGFRVAWVGRVAPVKRLELLLDAAERLPEVSFDIAGQIDAGAAYVEPIMERVRRMSNVTFNGRIERNLMPDFYRSASLLCCTSSYEGFPNSFLEAWSWGLPIVSMVDPDHLIADREMGFHVKTVPELVLAVRRLHQDHDLRQSMSEHARTYYLENHAVDPAMRKFERIFSEVLKERKGPS